MWEAMDMLIARLQEILYKHINRRFLVNETTFSSKPRYSNIDRDTLSDVENIALTYQFLS
jgi:hypothetical protein